MSEDYGKKYGTASDQALEILSNPVGAWRDRETLERLCGNRYSARILELKRRGYLIESSPSQTGHGKRYRLLRAEKGSPQPKRVKVFLRETDAQQLLDGNGLTPAAREAVEEALGSFRHNKGKL